MYIIFNVISFIIIAFSLTTSCSSNSIDAADSGESIRDNYIRYISHNTSGINKRIKPIVIIRKGDDYQAKLASDNKTFIIVDTLDLGDEDVEIGDFSVILFRRGSIINGGLIYNNTKILGFNRSFYNIRGKGSICNKIVYPEFYGAHGDGIHDDTRAIQRSLDNGGVIHLKEGGTYVVGTILHKGAEGENGRQSFLRVYSNTTIDGNGAVIKLVDHFLDKDLPDNLNNAQIFGSSNTENLSFRNIVIDGNGKNNLIARGRYAERKFAPFFRMQGVYNLIIENCTFKNCAGRNMVVLTRNPVFENDTTLRVGRNVKITKCSFINGGIYVGSSKLNENNTDFSFVYCDFNDCLFSNNVVSNWDLDKDDIEGLTNRERYSYLMMDGYNKRSWCGGFEIHSSNVNIKNNIFRGCQPAIYFSCDHCDINNTVITENYFVDCILDICSFPNNTKHRVWNTEISRNVSRSLPVLCGDGWSGLFCVSDSKVKQDSIVNMRIIYNDISSSEYALNRAKEDEKFYNGVRNKFALSIGIKEDSLFVRGNIFHNLLSSAIYSDVKQLSECYIENNMFTNCCIQYSTETAQREHNYSSSKSSVIMNIKNAYLNGLYIRNNTFNNTFIVTGYDGADIGINLVDGDVYKCFNRSVHIENNDFGNINNHLLLNNIKPNRKQIDNRGYDCDL